MMMGKTIHIASVLGRSMTQYEDDRLSRYIKDIRDRLKEVYGEVLPEKLDQEIDYIVRETYLVTRNDVVTYDINWAWGPKESPYIEYPGMEEDYSLTEEDLEWNVNSK